jgi:hypothetical protein
LLRQRIVSSPTALSAVELATASATRMANEPLIV